MGNYASGVEATFVRVSVPGLLDQHRQAVGDGLGHLLDGLTEASLEALGPTFEGCVSHQRGAAPDSSELAQGLAEAVWRAARRYVPIRVHIAQPLSPPESFSLGKETYAVTHERLGLPGVDE